MSSEQINQTFNILAIGNLIALGIAGNRLVEAHRKYTINLDIANANFRVSELLTRHIRDYIIHGDQKYLDGFWEAVTIRSGSTPWGKLLKLNWFKTKTETLSQLYDHADFNPEDRKFLEDAIDESTELIWDEIEAINWYNGYYDKDGKGREEFDRMGRNKKFITFSEKGEPNPQAAIDNLYTDDYLARKRKTEELSQEGVDRILNRADNMIKSYEILFYSFLALAIISVFVKIYYVDACEKSLY